MATVMGGTGHNDKLDFGGGSLIDNPGQNSDDQQSLNNNGDGAEVQNNIIRESNYNISQASYPEGIGSDSDKPHYIRFFINMRQKSQFLVEEKEKGRLAGKEVATAEQQRFQRERSQQDRITNAASSQNIGAVSSGAKAGLTVLGLLGIASKSKLGTFIGAGVGAGTGGTAGREIVREAQKGNNGSISGGERIESEAGIFESLKTDIPRRITDVITLHIQDRPAVNYSVGYTDDEIGVAGGFLTNSDVSNLSTMDAIKEMVRDGAAPLALQVLNTIGGLGGSFGGTLNSRRLLESGIKARTNPFREQFFERVDFRTFNFRHTFMPKSQAEANSVKQIIDLFKFHMHPEFLGDHKNAMFLYPSEFDIKYYYKTNENPFFNKISTCVLEDMNVEYGGDIFSTFETGQPVEVNMSLRFKEIELLTKSNIESRGL